MNYKIVKIEWVDSYGATRGWQELQDYEIPLLKVNSVGYLLKESGETIAIASTIAQETENTLEQANGIIVIPKASITSLKALNIE